MALLTPLQHRICVHLGDAPSRRLPYHKLAEALWPPAEHPKAWRYSSNGGPPGCYMSLSRALGQLQRSGVLFDHWRAPGDRVVRLL